jgi:uncharacterized OsmC-like protein
MTSKVIYKGKLRTEATHLKSHKAIITDAPTDNNGKGEAFSPTDLVATALASCLMTIMGIKANQMEISIDGAYAEIEKIMASDPRRISEVKVHIFMPDNNYSKKDQKILDHAARTCPVAMSLHPDIRQDIQFHWHT